jgi:hypothetical protein
MARRASRSRPVATFAHRGKVEVYLPNFELLETVRHLDIDKLARAASSEFEVGYFNTRCCQHLVRAVVRRGMATKLVSEPRPDSALTKVSPEFSDLLNDARRRAMRAMGRQSLDCPCQFMSSCAIPQPL